MVCVPDVMAALQRGAIDLEGVKAVQLAMIAHCELMGDRVAVIDPPPDLTPQRILDWRKNVAGYDSKYAAMYWPWVKVFDPVAMEACREQNPDLKITYCTDAASTVSKADALVLVTEWPEFKQLSLQELAAKMAHAVLIDGRNLFDPETARRAGFDYSGIGRNTRQGEHETARASQVLLAG